MQYYFKMIPRLLVGAYYSRAAREFLPQISLFAYFLQRRAHLSTGGDTPLHGKKSAPQGALFVSVF